MFAFKNLCRQLLRQPRERTSVAYADDDDADVAYADADANDEYSDDDDDDDNDDGEHDDAKDDGDDDSALAHASQQLYVAGATIITIQSATLTLASSRFLQQ